jgi:hypothetical protein
MNKTRKQINPDISAMNNLIQTVSPYEIIGLGEGSHGSYKKCYVSHKCYKATYTRTQGS